MPSSTKALTANGISIVMVLVLLFGILIKMLPQKSAKIRVCVIDSKMCDGEKDLTVILLKKWRFRRFIHSESSKVQSRRFQ